MRGLPAAALAELPAGDRDVLILIAWEQLTYDEAARALDIPIGTVRSRLNRARTRIRAVLAGSGQADTLKEILRNDLIIELRPAAPLAGPDEPGPARGRLTAAIMAERADAAIAARSPGLLRSARTSASAGRARSFRPIRPLALTGAVALVVAASVTAALLAVAGHGTRPVIRSATPGVSLTAAQVLD